MRRWRVMLALAVLLAACVPQPAWTDVKSERWWDDAVFYQVFVRSFSDSNGDGVGDFDGLTAKLDYLNDGNPETETDLGVTGIWLMPIFDSPSYHGYDVADYYTTNVQYGSLDSFKAFLAAAHERGIRVIIDFVINHTSVRHEWFRASEDQTAPYGDYYIWQEDNPDYNGPWGQEVWHPSGDRYYYGVFTAEMPDLNYTNPAVTEEIEQVSAFWLNEVGVDGFRMDGAKHMIEEGQQQENTDATHAWWKEYRAALAAASPDALVVGEVWSPTAEMTPYVNNGEMDLVFNFSLAEEIISSVVAGDGRRLGRAIESQERAFDPGNYAPFLSNHDQTRSMSRLGDGWNRAKAAATLLLTSPGTPFIYYGEEIGMTGDKPDPNLRTPMQWNGEQHAGFTTGNLPWSRVQSNYTERNVDLQNADPDSLLSHYRTLIRVRGEHHALRSGLFVPVTGDNNRLFAMLRVAEGESVLVLVNLSDEPISSPVLSWQGSGMKGTYQPRLIFGKAAAEVLTVADDGSVNAFSPVGEVPAWGSVIIQYR